MSIRPWFFLASLTSAGAGLLTLGADPAPVPDHHETWMLQVRRDGVSPRDVDYVLHLRAEDGVWSGSAAADLAMKDQPALPVSDITVTDAQLSFTLGALRFDGAVLLQGAADGAVTWVDPSGAPQRDAFTAARRAIPRFDLAHGDDGLPVAAPEAVGLDPALLDRLIYRAEKARSDALVVVADGERVADRTFGRPRGPLPLGKGVGGALGAADGAEMTARELAAAGQALLAQGALDGARGWLPRYGDDDEVIGYSVSSRHGAHLLVYPEAGLVAARLIAERPDDRRNQKHDERDDFYVMRRLADRLAVARLRSQRAGR